MEVLIGQTKKVNLLDNKVTYILLGAFISMIFNSFNSELMLQRENFFKEKIARQEFVLEFSKELKERIYKANNFFWGIANKHRKVTILKSWDEYRATVKDWNSNRASNIIDLDIKLPKSKYVVSDYSSVINDRLSFGEYYMSIHRRFMMVHQELIEYRKLINNSKYPSKRDIEILTIEIQNLDDKIGEYINALGNAARDEKH